MPAAIRPFRYVQVARYLMQWWLDTAPGLTARRKAAQERATRLIYAPKLRGRAMAAAAATAQVTEDDETPRARRAASHLGVDVVDRPPTAAEDAGVLLPRPDAHPDLHFPSENTEIYRLMNDDRAYMEGAMKAPREIIVLCHGESRCDRCEAPQRHGRVMELPPKHGPSATNHTGLYGFSTATPIPLFPSLKLHYWASVLEVLRDRMGAKVVVVGVKGYVPDFLSTCLVPGSCADKISERARSKNVRNRCTSSSRTTSQEAWASTSSPTAWAASTAGT